MCCYRCRETPDRTVRSLVARLREWATHCRQPRCLDEGDLPRADFLELQEGATYVKQHSLNHVCLQKTVLSAEDCTLCPLGTQHSALSFHISPGALIPSIVNPLSITVCTPFTSHNRAS